MSKLIAPPVSFILNNHNPCPSFCITKTFYIFELVTVAMYQVARPFCILFSLLLLCELHLLCVMICSFFKFQSGGEFVHLKTPRDRMVVSGVLVGSLVGIAIGFAGLYKMSMPRKN